MGLGQAAILLMSATLTLGQRGSFAGTKPIGFPELLNRTTTADGLGDRFGEGDATTQKLPLEALGDKNLVDRLSKLPQDHQSFWLLNAGALEANRQKPQIYPHRPSSFAQPINTVIVNPNPPSTQNLNAGFNANTVASNVGSGSNGNTGAGFNAQPSSQNFNAGSSNQASLVVSGFPNSPNSGVSGNLNNRFGNNDDDFAFPSNRQGNWPPAFFPEDQGSNFNNNINANDPYQNFGFYDYPGISVGNRNAEVTPDCSEPKEKTEEKEPITKV